MAASRLLKFYTGETSTALGAYDPNTNATGNLIGPHGSLVGFSAQQSFKWNAWSITPELAYTHLAHGLSIGGEQDHRYSRRRVVEPVVGKLNSKKR